MYSLREMPRLRAPKGWKRIAITESGTAVFTPSTVAGRIKPFKNCQAWVYEGSIYVRSERVWNSRPEVRAHEEEHIRQTQLFGIEAFHALYGWLNRTQGYSKNVFEVEARRAEGKKKRRKKH